MVSTPHLGIAVQMARELDTYLRLDIIFLYRDSRYRCVFVHNLKREDVKLISISIFVICELLITDPSTSTAVVTSFAGKVWIRRHDGSHEEAHILSDLFDGDTVETESESAVTVFHQEGRIFSLGSSSSLAICAIKPFQSHGALAADSPGIAAEFSFLFEVGTPAEKIAPEMVMQVPEDSMPLRVYKPGNTSLRTPVPDIIWGSYPGANWYRLTLQQMGEVIISIATTDTVWIYSSEHDTLTPGEYLLRVSAQSKEETLNEAERFIKILDEEEATGIMDMIRRISEQEPDDFTRHLLIAHIYERHSLRFDAVEAYQNLLRINDDGVPFVYKALARLYQALGMPERANHYLNTYEAIVNE